MQSRRVAAEAYAPSFGTTDDMMADPPASPIRSVCHLFRHWAARASHPSRSTRDCRQPKGNTSIDRQPGQQAHAHPYSRSTHARVGLSGVLAARSWTADKPGSLRFPPGLLSTCKLGALGSDSWHRQPGPATRTTARPSEMSSFHCCVSFGAPQLLAVAPSTGHASDSVNRPALQLGE